MPSQILMRSLALGRTHPEGGTGYPVSSDSVEPEIEIAKSTRLKKGRER